MSVMLIVNADDLGLTRTICDGVEKAHREGILTSATILAGAPFATYGATIAARNPSLSVGIHLQLVAGDPVTPDRSRIRTLIGPDGCFFSNYAAFFKEWHLGRIDPREVLTELVNQVRRCISLGIVPTHADSHQHVHMHPGLLPIFIETLRTTGIARMRFPVEPYSWRLHGVPRLSPGTLIKAAFMNPLYRCWYRRKVAGAGISCPDAFFGQYCSGALDARRIASFIEFLSSRAGASKADIAAEIMSHPGSLGNEGAHIPHCDEEFMKYSWAAELEALTDGAVKRLIDEKGLRLVGYKDLD